MKHLCACLALAALLGSARAQDPALSEPATTSAAANLVPIQHGYAIDQPEILIRQRLFGLAHGLSMLAAACLDLPEHSTPIQEAYAVWHARQAKTIESLVHELASYFFGTRAAEAQWPDLARALSLKDSIEPSLGEVTLADACASLPTAIARPRYALETLLAESTAPSLRPAPAITQTERTSPEASPATAGRTGE